MKKPNTPWGVVLIILALLFALNATNEAYGAFDWAHIIGTTQGCYCHLAMVVSAGGTMLCLIAAIVCLWNPDRH